jgi:hypothetical protein
MGGSKGFISQSAHRPIHIMHELLLDDRDGFSLTYPNFEILHAQTRFHASNRLLAQHEEEASCCCRRKERVAAPATAE